MKTKLYTLLLLLPLFSILVASPPSFPGAPNQGPIGGLGILAFAGGAMAYKKLRDKRKK